MNADSDSGLPGWYARSTYYDPHVASYWASRAPTRRSTYHIVSSVDQLRIAIAAYQPVIEDPPAFPPLLQAPPRPTVLTPADEYARLARRQRRIADEKKRIQKAARAARDKLYEARKAVKDAQQTARAARERAARYTYIPAPRIIKASLPSSRTAKTNRNKPKRSVYSEDEDDDEDWSQVKSSPRSSVLRCESPPASQMTASLTASRIEADLATLRGLLEYRLVVLAMPREGYWAECFQQEVGIYLPVGTT
jgi:hypothetical protein